MQNEKELYVQALAAVMQEERASIATIQRKCAVGYAHAKKIAGWLEDNGYVRLSDSGKEIELLITQEQFEKLYAIGARKDKAESCKIDIERYKKDALKALLQVETVSLSFLQAQLNVDYQMAGAILEWLEEKKYVSPFAGAKARKVLLTKEQFQQLYEN